MRFLPLGQVAVPIGSAVFVGVGAVAVIYGAAVGLTQRRPRSLLAYSSMSQMGLMTVGVGVGLASPDHWPMLQTVLLLYALHHALAKGALFYGLGVEGWARLGLWLPALALAGLPFTGGALAKGLLKSQVHLLPDAWSTLAAWILPVGSLGTALLMARFLVLALHEDDPRDPVTPASWWALLAGVSLLPWIWPLSLERTSPLWSALWPVLLAAGPAWFVYKGGFGRWLSAIPAIPPGDLLILFERWLPRMPKPHAAHPEHEKEHPSVLLPRAAPASFEAPERALGRWPVAVILFLLLVIGIFSLLAGRFL